MFGAGVAINQAFLNRVLAVSDTIRERSRRRMHTSDMEALQAQVDQLRSYVTTLFQILIMCGAFCADKARQLMASLDSTADGEYYRRDVVTGDELPPEINPFSDLGAAGG